MVSKNVWNIGVIYGKQIFFFLFEQIFQKKSKLTVQDQISHLHKFKSLNSIVIFTFSVLDQKYTFWANLVQKLKSICSRGNLVFRLIQVCRFRWYFFVMLCMGNSTFSQIWSIKSKCIFKMKLGAQTNSNMLDSKVMFICPFLHQMYPLWTNVDKHIKIVFLRSNLSPRLLQIIILILLLMFFSHVLFEK